MALIPKYPFDEPVRRESWYNFDREPLGNPLMWLYKNEKLHYLVQKLKLAIEKTWYKRAPKTLNSLVLQIENRVFDLIMFNGNAIFY